MASKKNNPKTLVFSMNNIRSTVEREGNLPDIIKGLADELALVRDRFGVSEPAAVLLADILEMSGRSGADEDDLAKYLGVSNIQFIESQKYLRELEEKGIVQRGSCRGRVCYRVTPETTRAVEKEDRFQAIPMTGLTGDELFSRFRKVFSDFQGEDDPDRPDRALARLDKLVEENQQLDFCRRVLALPIYTEKTMNIETERRIFFFLCNRFVTHGEAGVELERLLELTDFFEDDRRLKRHISNGNTVLQRSGLVTFGNNDGFSDAGVLALSDEVKGEFFSEVELTPEEQVRYRDLVSSAGIAPKELFFNHVENEQIDRLGALIEPEAFKAVQERLEKVGMRRGFNALFYGGPGTGKTACAYELARRTGRDLFVVDVTKLRSKWVGDSEKSVKAVFNIYRKLCRTSELDPILLFNEADAIFAKRFENVDDSVDQMNNTIQNIILQEMENLEGLLIATTNLATNLDPAFERRFIFKVEFKMPEADSRAKIWKSMIPSLSEEDACALAGRYPFSGGNIENVARKSTVEYVLSGNEPTLDTLDGHCREEILSRRKTRNKIGF
jgi:predicted transcriptional regulator